MSKAVTGGSKVEGLTIIRFFAALCVFFDHYAAEILKPAPFFIRNLLDRGSAGVTLFFILSGFLLVMVYAPRAEQGKIDVKKFYLARVARIYPAYLFALVISVPWMIIWVKANGWGTGLQLPVYILTKLTMTDAWYSLASDPYKSAVWLLQGWSLTCEGFFYLLFPFMLPILMKLKTRELGWLFVASLVWVSVWNAEMDPRFNDYPALLGKLSLVPIFRIGDFIMGMVVAKLMIDSQRLSETIAKYRLHLVGLVIVFQMLTPESIPSEPLFIFVRVLYCLLIASVGVGFVVKLKETRSSKWKDRLVLLGESSFALYLIQSFVADGSRIVFAKFFGIPNDAWQQWAAFLLLLVTSTIASVFMFRFVETPSRVFLTKRFSRA